MWRNHLLVVLGCVAVAGGARAAVPTESWPDLLRQERYAELTESLVDLDRRFQQGEFNERQLWRLLKPVEKAPAELLPKLDAWVKHSGEHGLVLLARGLFFHGHGWLARGEKFARDTSREQFMMMHDYFARANADLEAAKSKLPRCDLCYSALISVATAQGEREARVRWYSEAMQRNPMAWGAPVNYLHGLWPRWGGRPGEAANFVAKFKQDYPSNLAGQALEADLLVDQADEYYRMNSYPEAIALYERAFALDPQRGNTWHRMAYSYGSVKQFDKALLSAERSIAIDPGEKTAHQVRAWALMRMGRGPESVPSLEKAAALGDVWSLREALQVFANGKYGTPPDRAKTWQLCDTAARAGVPEGYGCLGGHYYHGYHVKADHAEAAKWFRIAADKGQRDVMTDLGIMYWNGDGVERSEKNAIHYWRKALKAGDARAEEKLRAHLSGWRYFWEITWSGWTQSASDAMASAVASILGVMRALFS
jgi:TPR repeat protein